MTRSFQNQADTTTERPSSALPNRLLAHGNSGAVHSGEQSRSTAGLPLIVHEVLNSPGKPLDQHTRHFMEPRFARDFSQMNGQSALQASASQLQIGPVDDHYEREADTLAERVMRSDEPPPPTDRGFDFSQVRIHTDERAGESARAVDALAY